MFISVHNLLRWYSACHLKKFAGLSRIRKNVWCPLLVHLKRRSLFVTDWRKIHRLCFLSHWAIFLLCRRSNLIITVCINLLNTFRFITIFIILYFFMQWYKTVSKYGSPVFRNLDVFHAFSHRCFNYQFITHQEYKIDSFLFLKSF